MNNKITVAPGDGIGPEIMESVLEILSAAKSDISVDLINIGQTIYESGNLSGIKENDWETIKKNKVILKSPITTPQGKGCRSLNVRIRKELGLYANIRPCKNILVNDNIDIVTIRENSEDLYSGVEYRFTKDLFIGKKYITNNNSWNICKFAFEYAKANNRKKVTCLIKDNIMKMTDGAFHDAFQDTAYLYPEIQHDSYLLDIGLAYIATRPEDFDVIVTLNLYGDVASDIVSEVVGSVGMSGSVNIGKEYAMFEAVHGSAPGIAGKNIANPSGLLNAAIYMLDYLDKKKAAQSIMNAWLNTIEEGIHTEDIFDSSYSRKKVSTKEFTQEIISRIQSGNYIDSSNNHAILLPKGEISKNEIETHNEISLNGVDLSLKCNQNEIKIFTNKATDFNKNGLKLENIYVIGISIWPTQTLSMPSCFDSICCRFIAHSEISHAEINTLMQNITEAGWEIHSMDKLYNFNNKRQFWI